jgi:pyruvate/2-oxoglutarate dehydrogenase complex dihydrolipoamide dehydrogenase (E3) component
MTMNHDEQLRALTRPAGWTNPRPAPCYNLAVIGAGPAGLVCAAGAAGLGARVALIEKQALGGDCLHSGCVPSKAILRCGRAASAAKRAREFGVDDPGDVRVDFPRVMERMRRLRAGIAHIDRADRFRQLGIDVFFGEGRFSGVDTIEVAGATLRFAKAVIATGSTAAIPEPLSFQPGEYLTNETVFSLSERPRRLLVLGSGAIGCELGQALARLGCEVHLVNRSGRILSREEPEASAIVEAAMRRDGVHLHLNAKILGGGVRDGRPFVNVKESAGEITLEGDQLLIATGRRPQLAGLKLEAAGIAYSDDGVMVNDRLRTTNSRVFAAGDVCSRYRYTHAADAMARLVLRNALFFGRGRASRLVIPHCTYTDPEVASVGLTAAEAIKSGVAIDSYRVPLDDVDRAILDGETDGVALVHVRRGTDRIVGATVVASHAGDWINELTLAMQRRIGLGSLASVVRPYPTQAEAVKKLADAFQRTRLTPRRAAILRWLLRRFRGGD